MSMKRKMMEPMMRARVISPVKILVRAWPTPLRLRDPRLGSRIGLVKAKMNMSH